MKLILKKVWQYIVSMDKLIVLLCIACSALSCILLYSMVENKIYYYTDGLYKTQAFASLLGIAAALVVAAFDYKTIARLWFLYVPLSLFFVLLTFTSLGISRADDRAWLNLFGVISFQPAEILKIAFILSFAFHLSKVSENMNKLRHMALLLAHGGIIIAITALQGDFGTSLVFVFIFLVMLFAAGLSWVYVLASVIAAPIMGALVWFFALQPHHRDRIMVIFKPDDVAVGIADQQDRGLIALGSGQLTGKGLFGGKYVYVYEMQNDFIFSYVGQVFGFIGCIIVVGLLALICIKLLTSARLAKDILGKNICVGVFAMISFHTIINIGMVLGVLPVIGIPLPFISAGGTSVVTLYVAIGLAMSVYSHRVKPYAMFYDKQ